MPTLDWLTRAADPKTADAVPYRLLDRVADLSQGPVDAANMLIEGDNG